MRLLYHSPFRTRRRALRFASLLILLIAAATKTAVVAAQRVSYSTILLTTCFSFADDEPTSPPPPPCGAYGCPSCTLTSVYTVTLALLCPTGLTQKPYTITETYVGMSALPTFAGGKLTSVPYGFTTAVETCGACTTVGAGEEGGDGKPLVGTVTLPSGGRPYVEGFVPEETAKQDATDTATVGQGAGGSGGEGSGGQGGRGSGQTPLTFSTAHPSSASTQAEDHGASSPVVANSAGRCLAEMGALFIAVVAIAIR
ncbi:hypothetical protein DL764_008212 [Monosporascus ibericus]|uniref:Uncharacterized protein n=1 Tax=Monosporascus ibericus TaxID=155417 RepID=A0A4Q4SY19_9PEZI|nr:hypothetical protein DL764_008212 [Monosporascus ibericus]